MIIVKPSATHMEHNVSPYEFIEKVGRICYKSTDKITEGSAEKFVASLVKSKHMAMLEHETLYFITTEDFMKGLFREAFELGNEHLKFFNVTRDSKTRECVISGSFRSFYDLFERGIESDYYISKMQGILKKEFPLVFGEYELPRKFEYVTDCILLSRTEFIFRYEDRPEVLSKHLTHTFLFVCDRGVSHEFVRHRVCAFAQESTRYCNYSKDKFGGQITVIEPCFFEEGSPTYGSWWSAIMVSETAYFDLLKNGATPQEARSVLPNSLKTELVITATEEEWQHIVNLRYKGTTGAPHPQMKEVMSLAVEDLRKESGGRVEYR